MDPPDGSSESEQPLWSPTADQVADTRLAAFAEHVGRPVDFEGLHDWSVRDPDAFWNAAWDFTGVVGDKGAGPVIEPGQRLRRTRFFPAARLNVAEHILQRAPLGPAIFFRDETGAHRELTGPQLARAVRELAGALRSDGVGPGHCVAAWLPNIPEAVIAALAAAAVGATFTSTSPDFGVDGVVDRFGAVEPTVLLAADGYVYGGRRFDCLSRLAEIRERIPSVRRTVVVPHLESTLGPRAGSEAWGDYLDAGTLDSFERFGFDQPLYVLYSSGTTGPPKAIVHRAGGVLIKHLVEHQLHCDIRPDDRVVYFTTTGWMMWNWLLSVLGSGASIVLYDGSPSTRDGNILFDVAQELGVTLFGTSAKFLDGINKSGLRPAETHDLSTIRTVTSTGSPLSPEGFRYVYDHLGPDLHVASISGGTDLCGCLVAGDPTAPVWAGEIQAPTLGLDIDVAAADGASLESGEGDLICRNAFPSMPLRLWDDPEDRHYDAAYFEQVPGAWAQGDFASRGAHGGFVIHGRSDATLNPGGVRIGTAEVYRRVDAVDRVLDSLVVAQRWDDDTRIVLFVKLAVDDVLDDDLITEIKTTIRSGATPRHVPARVLQVPDIPVTRSGKKVELAVRRIIHGEPVVNREALSNPDSLDAFADRPELSQ